MLSWMVLFWGTIFAIAIWGISKLIQRGKSEMSSLDKHGALDIAKERYAKGEISRDDFEQIKKDLS